jgi:peptidoglycan hydrolase CwlO-like protein
MIDRLLVLKEEKPLIYKLVMVLLAIPILGIAIVSIVNPALRSWLVSSARKLMEKTQKKDQELKNQIGEAQKEIEKIDKKIEEVDHKLENIDNIVDIDWHKKVKK